MSQKLNVPHPKKKIDKTSQAAIAADAQDTYVNTISSPIPDDSE